MKKVVLLTLGLCVLVAGLAVAADTIKIGVMAPLTGAWANEGQEMKQIVELLAEEINAKDGLLGQKIEVITEDDGGDPKTAALAAQRLSTQGATIVIGTYGSAVTEASQNIYDEAKIIQIATGSTAVRLTEKNLKYFFRTCPRDDDQGKVIAKTILEQGYKKVAILHDNSTYSKGLADETKGQLEGKVEIVFYDALTPGENDYSTILTKLQAAQPDLIFASTYYPETGLLLRQKKQMGWNVQLMGGDSNSNPDLIKIAGPESAAGYLMICPPVPADLPTEEAKAFLAAYQKKFNGVPGSIWAVLAGDALLVAVEGIKGANGVDADQVADYLHTKLKDFPGLTGKLSFNEKGDRVGDVYLVYTVDAAGKFVLQAAK